MRRALITGCGTGIGRGAAVALVRDGWHVTATMRNSRGRRPALLAEVEGLEGLAGTLQIRELDVRDAAQRASVCEQVSAAGSLDLLVNNAGFAQFGALEDLDEGQLRDQLEVNFVSAALLTRDLLPSLRAARGKILNVSSLFGVVGFPLTSAYCASKYALEGFSEALRYELMPHSVQVGLLAPGGHRTSFASNVRWGTGESEVFARQTQNYRQLHRRLSQRDDGPDPARVVQAIVRLARRDRVPVRTFVGRDAHLMRGLKALLPALALDRLFDWSSGHLFLREER